jgi:hypothetical protein
MRAESVRRPLFALLALAAATPCWAQSDLAVEAGVLTDHRVRGLSWSDGEAAPQVYGRLPLGGLALSGQATAARGAQRHGGADAAIALSASYRGEAGLLRWQGGVTGHMFPGGAGDQDFYELDGEIAGMIGPLDLAMAARYAPSQHAIGGSNLHIGASAELALIGTPVTITANVGHSSGSADDALRAARLRPGGNYVDWSVGGRYVLRDLTFSLAYMDTDIVPGDLHPIARSRHFGAKLVAGVHLAL